MSAGIEHKLGEHSVFSADYVREIGTQFPLGIDTNHVGDAGFLTDGSNSNGLLNTYAAELSAINATVANAGCPAANFAGVGAGGSQASINCYLNAVPGASITDFARNGLDSSNAFCGPFPCSVLGKPQAAFGGINPAVGSNIMYFPSGRSLYSGLHLGYKTSIANPTKRVGRLDIAIAYAWSHYETNIAESNGSGGDYSIMNVAEDYNRPHRGHFWDVRPGSNPSIDFHPHRISASWTSPVHDRPPRLAPPTERLYPATGWRRSCRRNLSQRPHWRWHRG